MTKRDRRPIVAGNWKMNKTNAEAQALVRDLRNSLAVVRDQVEVVLAPPFTALYPVARGIEDSNLHLAAQMLKEVGCTYVIVGHSERRQYFGETDETVNRRAKAVIAAGMRPIICVGETLTERESGRTLEIVSRQLQGGLEGLTPELLRTSVIAYEPVWAIGTGKTATSAQAQEVHAHIREWLTQSFGRDAAIHCRIQYGGSVKADNAQELLSKPDVD